MTECLRGPASLALSARRDEGVGDSLSECVYLVGQIERAQLLLGQIGYPQIIGAQVPWQLPLSAHARTQRKIGTVRIGSTHIYTEDQNRKKCQSCIMFKVQRSSDIHSALSLTSKR